VRYSDFPAYSQVLLRLAWCREPLLARRANEFSGVTLVSFKKEEEQD